VKERLRQNTQWALERGIFGVPTFVVGDELFWGHDAFDMLLDYLADRPWFETTTMRAADTLPVGVMRERAGGGAKPAR